ncbi:MAG: efflux RND transporter periplasmic adaptor subunit [Planctomycetota bacterium]
MNTHRTLGQQSLCCLALFILAIGVQQIASGQVLSSFTEPMETADLAISEPGTLREIPVRLGQSVDEGQTVAQLDTSVQQANRRLAVIAAESNAKVLAAEVRLAMRSRRLMNVRRVHEGGHASQTELEEADMEFRLAETDLQLAKEELMTRREELARIDAEIEQRVARAPFAGVVTKLHKEVGEYVSSAEPSIVTLVRLDRLRVKFYLTTAQCAELTKGDKMFVHLEGLGRTTGVVNFVSPVTDADTSTARVDVILDNRQSQFRSGVRCDLLIDSDQE